MKPRQAPLCLVAAAALAITLLPALADERPPYCNRRPDRALTPDQEARCSVDPIKAEEARRQAETLQPPTYPFSRPGYLTVDPSSGQQIPLTLQSRDGREITFTDAKGIDRRVLKPAEITGWMSTNAGSGTDASSAVTVAVAGALFFFPMMLAAPFMVRSYTITSFQIDSIDSYGRDVSLNVATIDSPKPTMELLQFSTGLTAGTRRGPETTQPLYEAGLKQSMLELERLRQPLLVVNHKKPWCSTVSLGNNPDSAAYRSMVDHIGALRRRLNVAPLNDWATQSTDQQWQAYLAARPGLRQWAATYKQQADALKRC